VVLASLKELVDLADQALKGSGSYGGLVWLDRVEEVLWADLYKHRRFVRPQILDHCTQQQREWLEQSETRLERALGEVEEALKERLEQARFEAKSEPGKSTRIEDEIADRRRARAARAASLEGTETGT
jgi:hypothetical protein